MKLGCLLILLFPCMLGKGQSVGEFLPHRIDASRYYIFYLHGALVTELGNNAINQSVPEWGPYEFYNILDSLEKRNFEVISEIRKKGVHDSVYVNKVASQADSLLKARVKPSHILVLGASAGWDIGIRVSAKLKNRKMNFVIMGGCWPETYKEYLALTLYGRFLSVIESSDPHGTCVRIFENRKINSNEITLNTGLSHGFIYKGYRTWIDPIEQWFRGQ